MTSNPSVVAQDVPVRDVWQRLTSNPDAVLVDVRTRAEWQYVGVPELSGLGKRVLLVEWQTFPDGTPNPAFVSELSAALAAAGAGSDADIYFICRSGARSQHAAQAMIRAGYSRCFNAAEGFEGPLDDVRHRGSRAGWKAEGLPWVQG